MTQQIQLLYDDGIVPKFSGGVLDLRSAGGPIPPGPDPIPIPPNPNPIPPLPPGVGYDVIPNPNGQVKKDYGSAMILDLPTQPAGKPNELGLLRTAPQIGGDTEAGGATVEWTDGSGVRQARTYDAPFTAYYTTDQPNEGAYFQCQVGSTIRVSVLNPVRPWFLDYRTPNA